ncbi:hypothetical protein SBOR_7048 [Sclerotinia borealis F-4128]|uniref:DUF7918 domain-containing protein n=1 Tax=Sclerotinia borealis (strain F-4128) TaxID=1432307 RepID=W9C9T5_SCLBF|nr:hypothetical protein SBOR_7048 [Sclerotinia borealis F-4128]
MAILPGVPYVRVSVTTPKNAVEYPDPDDGQDGDVQDGSRKNMSVYFESKTGTNFGFRYDVDNKKMPWGKKKKKYCLGFFATIDGRKTSSTVICNEDGFKPNMWEHNLNGERLRQPGSTKFRPFQFAEIQIGDDALFADPKQVSQLGELVVQVWRVRKSKPVPTPVTQQEHGIVPANTKFREQQLKGRAVSHATELGKPQVSSDMETFYKLEYVDPIQKPLAEFHFKYRSREILQQMMILPRDPKLPLNFDLAPFVAKPVPRVPMLPPLIEKPPATAKSAVENIEALTAQKRKAATEMATPTQTTTNSAITGRSFDQVTNNAFSSSSAPPQAFCQIAPKAVKEHSTTNTGPAKPIEAPEEITYPTTPAFGSIPQVGSGFSSKAGPALPVETPAKAIFRPDVRSLASADLRAASGEPLVIPSTPLLRVASEPANTPFTRVLIEINKNLSRLRDIAKGRSFVNVVEVRDELLQVEDEIPEEVEIQVKPEQYRPEENLKRERVIEQDEDDIEIVLERPVKRRHIFSEEDEIIDLTAD